MTDLDKLPKIDPAIKERWLTALRSGDYTQTVGQLRNSEGFCCLGVLCDVVKDDLGVEWGDAIEKGLRGFDDVYVNLPDAVWNLLAVTNHQFDKLDSMEPLVTRNDGHVFVGCGKRQTFKQIANIIENRC